MNCPKCGTVLSNNDIACTKCAAIISHRGLNGDSNVRNISAKTVLCIAIVVVVIGAYAALKLRPHRQQPVSSHNIVPVVSPQETPALQHQPTKGESKAPERSVDASTLTSSPRPDSNRASKPKEEDKPDYNVALNKSVTVRVFGNQSDPGDGGDPQVITDGQLNYDERNEYKASNGVIGWVNRTDDQTMKVKVRIDLKGTFRISKIQYNQGDVSRAATWNADYMISPFGKTQTSPGGEYRGAWTAQSGDIVRSSVDVEFVKIKSSWERDWLFIGEIEVYGHRYYSD
jgi:hypothetical protein